MPFVVPDWHHILDWYILVVDPLLDVIIPPERTKTGLIIYQVSERHPVSTASRYSEFQSHVFSSSGLRDPAVVLSYVLEPCLWFSFEDNNLLSTDIPLN